jgi:integration host factor subunit beta
MTKADLVRRLADANPHLYRHDIERIVATVFGRITAALARGDRVELRGFGAFSTRVRGGRTARNPRTGERVVVPDRAAPPLQMTTAGYLFGGPHPGTGAVGRS